MFVLKKLITSFLLPPGIFIVILFGCGAWHVYRKKFRLGAFLLIFACLMWAVTLTPVSHALMRSLEKSFKLSADIRGDVIILLGGGVNDGAPDFDAVGTLSEEALARLVAAVRLQKKLRIPVIASGGAAYDHIKNSEAKIARRFMIDLGVPSGRIIAEAKSRDTFENAVNSIAICRQHGFQQPILITSAYHMKRALMNFEKAGMNVNPFPANFRTWENRRYGWNDYLPGEFEDTRIAVKEYLGLIYTRLMP